MKDYYESCDFMKTVCIIQARSGSTRLPKKILKHICGKTVLEHDIDRIRRAKKIDEIVIATTNSRNDDVIFDKMIKLNINVFRGSEQDVLSRYYYAAKESLADVVIRITSDCPLIDSKLIDKILDFYLHNCNKYDYVSNTINRTFPRGLDVEVFSFEALTRAFNESTLLRDREHVTPYIWDNPNIFRIGEYVGDKDYSNLRWTLDTKEDLKLIRKIYSYLYEQKGNDFYMEDILTLYKNHMDLYFINNKICQKNID